MLICET